MSNNHLFKNIIIGSGAGGSIVANEIIKSGNDTLLIEEGKKYDLSYFKKNSLSRRAIDLWRNGGITPLIGKPPIAYVEGVAFGGTTVTNGGVMQRPSHELIDSWANKFEISNFNYRDLIKHFNYIEKKLNVISVEDYSSNDDSNILINTLKKNNISYRQARLAHKNCVNSNQCISGCPTGAKQSNLSLNYLPEAIEKGLKIKLNNKVLKIKKDNQKFKIETNKSNFFCENLYVCAGATQSAYLLRKHKLSRFAGRNIKFHLNLKIGAFFKSKIFANNSTIFSIDVDHYKKQGFTFNAANFQKEYFFSSFPNLDNKKIIFYNNNLDNCGIYVTQIKIEGQANLFHNSFIDNPIITYKLREKDVTLISNSIKYLSEILFDSGASELVLPSNNSNVVKSMQEVKNFLDNLDIKKLNMVCAHMMGACKIGNKFDSVVDLDGGVKNFKNIKVFDSSIIPENIGESPQLSIMSIVREIMQQNQN